MNRRLASWLAALAVLMAALAPSISQALNVGVAGSWAEVCSTAASTLIKSGEVSTDSQPNSGSGHAFEHCPYCSLHSDIAALPPASADTVLAPLPRFGVPTLFLAAPHTLHAWATAQARAPPTPA